MSKTLTRPAERYTIRIERYPFNREGVTGVEYAIQAFWDDGEEASPNMREAEVPCVLGRVAGLIVVMESPKGGGA